MIKLVGTRPACTCYAGLLALTLDAMHMQARQCLLNPPCLAFNISASLSTQAPRFCLFYARVADIKTPALLKSSDMQASMAQGVREALLVVIRSCQHRIEHLAHRLPPCRYLPVQGSAYDAYSIQTLAQTAKDRTACADRAKLSLLTTSRRENTSAIDQEMHCRVSF